MTDSLLINLARLVGVPQTPRPPLYRWEYSPIGNLAPLEHESDRTATELLLW